MCLVRRVEGHANGFISTIECYINAAVMDEKDAGKIINKVLKSLEDSLGVSLETSLKGVEVIGERFILYKFGLGDLGECRVIVDSDRNYKIGRIICALRKELKTSVIDPALTPRDESVFPKAPRGVIEGLPRGQRVIPKPVVYAVKGLPRIDLGEWRLWVEGLVEHRLSLSYSDLLSMGLVRIDSMFHCVTGWSIGKRGWEGVPLKRIAGLAGVKSSARWVFVEGLDGYTTIIPLEDFLHPQSLLVLKVNGEPLDIEHGFPARIFIPHLYGWKHAKWVRRIVFREDYVDGYWEALGYHERGNAWLEERFKGV